MKTVSLKVEMKCSCFYKTENNCVKMTNRKRQNWLSATTSPSSRRQITFSCSVYWSVSVCFQDTQEDVLCLQMQKHTARSCSHTHRHIDRHTQCPEAVENSEWAEGRKTRTEPSSSSFTFNWERVYGSSCSGRRLDQCVGGKETNADTNWSTYVLGKCNLFKC